MFFCPRNPIPSDYIDLVDANLRSIVILFGILQWWYNRQSQRGDSSSVLPVQCCLVGNQSETLGKSSEGEGWVMKCITQPEIFVRTLHFINSVGIQNDVLDYKGGVGGWQIFL